MTPFELIRNDPVNFESHSSFTKPPGAPMKETRAQEDKPDNQSSKPGSATSFCNLERKTSLLPYNRASKPHHSQLQ